MAAKGRKIPETREELLDDLREWTREVTRVSLLLARPVKGRSLPAVLVDTCNEMVKAGNN